MPDLMNRMADTVEALNNSALESRRSARAEFASRVLRVIEAHPGDPDMAVSIIKKMAEDAR